jgi:hypothetical protein
MRRILFTILLMALLVVGAQAAVTTSYADFIQGGVVWNVTTFTGTGQTTWTAPSDLNTTAGVWYLVVAGGGGGGDAAGGGGGAGGLLNGTYAASASTSYYVTVGAGGVGGSSNNVPGKMGQNSSFANTTVTDGFNSKGGGGGSGVDAGVSLNGGSGGGGSYWYTSAGTATSGQGNIGGTGTHTDPPDPTGGGGGCGAAGQDGNLNNGGNGGIGCAISINGTAYYYAGGGGGGDMVYGAYTCITYPPGAGGSGGGGSAVCQGYSNPGADGYGGGGGGAGYYWAGYWVWPNAGKGGSGVVILRYNRTPSGTAPTAAFACSPLVGDRGFSTTCTDSSTGTPTSWDWFGQSTNPCCTGNTTTQNPAFKVNNTGYCGICMEATNAQGSSTACKANYIYVRQPYGGGMSYEPPGWALNLADWWDIIVLGNHLR